MSSERRRYFRVDDYLGISYQILSEADIKSYHQKVESASQQSYLTSAGVENRIHMIIEALKIPNPELAELASLLNRKVNMLVSRLEVEMELVQRVAHTLREANVSACGLGVIIEELIPKDTWVALDLVLKPDENLIQCLAKVVSCTEVKEDPGKYYLRMNFEYLTENDQEILIQHIVKRQSRYLRERRQPKT